MVNVIIIWNIFTLPYKEIYCQNFRCVILFLYMFTLEKLKKDHLANNNYSFYVKNNIFMQIYYVYYH